MGIVVLLCVSGTWPLPAKDREHRGEKGSHGRWWLHDPRFFLLRSLGSAPCPIHVWINGLKALGDQYLGHLLHGFDNPATSVRISSARRPKSWPPGSDQTLLPPRGVSWTGRVGMQAAVRLQGKVLSEGAVRAFLGTIFPGWNWKSEPSGYGHCISSPPRTAAACSVSVVVCS